MYHLTPVLARPVVMSVFCPLAGDLTTDYLATWGTIILSSLELLLEVTAL